MGGTSRTEQQTQQSSQTNPWAPTQGILKNILGGIGGQVGNYQPTAAENAAIGTIRANAGATPNFTPQATGLTTDLLSGGPDRTGILGDAYGSAKTALSPYLNQDWLDPTKIPGIQAALGAVRNDVSNSVNGMFAGAGRDLSGLNQQTLARGIAQGEAPILFDQFNRNVGTQQNAASMLPQLAGNAADILSSLDSQSLARRLQGLGVGTEVLPQVANAGATNTLSAEGLARGLPLQNLGLLENLTVPIAGLGGQSSGTSSMQGSYTMSPVQQAAMWGQALSGSGGGGLLGSAGKFLGLFGR